MNQKKVDLSKYLLQGSSLESYGSMEISNDLYLIGNQAGDKTKLDEFKTEHGEDCMVVSVSIQKSGEKEANAVILLDSGEYQFVHVGDYLVFIKQGDDCVHIQEFGEIVKKIVKSEEEKV